MTPVAVYARASTEMQIYSTENQLQFLHGYADSHGMEVVATFIDQGRSGLDLDGRPALRDLFQTILAGTAPFPLLLVYDVSRWGRFQDSDESAHYEFLCRKAGVQVVYVAEPFDNDGTPVAAIMKAIKRSMAAEYSRELSAKVIRGKRTRAAKGFAPGRAPYGLRRLMVDQQGNPRIILQAGEWRSIATDHTVFVPGPRTEVETVRRIFRMYGELGRTLTEIEKFLNDHGVLSADGKSWSIRSIKDVLQNQAYIGNLIYGRSSAVLRTKPIKTLPERWICVKGAYKGIVTKAAFAKAQQVLAVRARPVTDEDYLRPLRLLFEREGYLSGRLIDAEPGMPSARAYDWRFGGLPNACLRVGFEPPFPERARTGPKCKVPWEREAMLRHLKELLDREGYLTRPLIQAQPHMASLRGYHTVFGNISEAYRLVGYEPPLARVSRAGVARGRRRQPPD